ncbi:MAG: hypothetical protein P8I74_02465, partial [Phycisphaerales bacterium]|nr:hypothetical protein [Phycisphaerales bacterium]
MLLADSGLILDLGLMPESDDASVLVVLLSLLPTVLVTLVTMAIFSMLHARMDRPGPRGLRPILRRGDRCMVVARWLILINYLAAVLVLDWLGAMRSFTGALLLIDEVLVMLPPLVAILSSGNLSAQEEAAGALMNLLTNAPKLQQRVTDAGAILPL